MFLCTANDQWLDQGLQTFTIVGAAGSTRLGDAPTAMDSQTWYRISMTTPEVAN